MISIAANRWAGAVLGVARDLKDDPYPRMKTSARSRCRVQSQSLGHTWWCILRDGGRRLFKTPIFQSEDFFTNNTLKLSLLLYNLSGAINPSPNIMKLNWCNEDVDVIITWWAPDLLVEGEDVGRACFHKESVLVYDESKLCSEKRWIVTHDPSVEQLLSIID